MSIAVSVCLLLCTIVFRPGPIQGLGSGFWPDHRVARINFFLKSKRCYFSKKNKSQLVATEFLTGSSGQPTGSHWVFSSPVFFFNPTYFQSWIDSILDWSIKPDQFLKQCFRLCNWGNILYYTSSCVSSRSWCCFCMCKTVIGGYSCGPKIASPYCVGAWWD